MTKGKSEGPEVDPLAPMIHFFDRLGKSMAGTMSEVASNKSMIDLASKQMASDLDAAGSLRRQAAELMEECWHQVSLPSRTEVVSLAERLTNIEMRLDDMDAKLDEALDYLRAMRHASGRDE